MTENDPQTDRRSKQRLTNYQKALGQLQKFPALNELNEFEEQGLVQAFEYTFELAWKTLQDILVEQDNQNLYGVRSVIEEAFKVGLIKDGKGWMEMLKSRNQTSHTYNEEVVEDLKKRIKNDYVGLFENLLGEIEKYYEKYA